MMSQWSVPQVLLVRLCWLCWRNVNSLWVMYMHSPVLVQLEKKWLLVTRKSKCNT